jgi:hypothetical protein
MLGACSEEVMMEREDESVTPIVVIGTRRG